MKKLNIAFVLLAVTSVALGVSFPHLGHPNSGFSDIQEGSFLFVGLIIVMISGHLIIKGANEIDREREEKKKKEMKELTEKYGPANKLIIIQGISNSEINSHIIRSLEREEHDEGSFKYVTKDGKTVPIKDWKNIIVVDVKEKMIVYKS